MYVRDMLFKYDKSVLNSTIPDYPGNDRSVRQTTYLGSRLAVDDLPFSRLAVDDLPGSRLVNAEVIFAIDFEICNLRRLKVKSSTIVWFQKKFQRT